MNNGLISRFAATASPISGVLALACAVLVSAPTGVDARTIQFSGLTWIVKSGFGGPGPNSWSDSTQSVWVDTNGALRLKIRQIGGVWHSAEVFTVDSFGYGTYLFQVASEVDQFTDNVIVGLFTYLDDLNEIDIEFGRWGNPASTAGQFVTQPAISGNILRFDLSPAGSLSTHSFTWRPNSIFYQSFVGQHDELPAPAGFTKIQDWTYTGQDIPAAGGERLRINLWQVGGAAPSDGQEVELVIPAVRFTFIPGDCDGDGFGTLDDYSLFSLCLIGPDQPLGAGCECADLAQDNAVDLLDFDQFQKAIVGVCGDGNINAGEQCDPPDGVTCDPQCQLFGCGNPGSGDCFVANGTPGCDDQACCDLICASFPACCNVGWTAPCAGFAQNFCTP